MYEQGRIGNREGLGLADRTCKMCRQGLLEWRRGGNDVTLVAAAIARRSSRAASAGLAPISIVRLVIPRPEAAENLVWSWPAR